MSFVLRAIGVVWILLSAKEVWALVQRIIAQGIHVSIGLGDFLALVMLAGGVGLLLLREWGRWVILIGAAAAFLLHSGPSLIRLNFGPYFIRNLVFYGVFIALLLIPQARSATRK